LGKKGSKKEGQWGRMVEGKKHVRVRGAGEGDKC